MAFDALEFLAKPGQDKTISRFKPGQVVFKQGAKSDLVFYLLSGLVKQTVMGGPGKEATICIVEPGRFCGTCGIEGHPARLWSAHAVTAATVTAITTTAMFRMMAEQPEFSQFFISYLLRRNTEMESELRNLLTNTGERRLARKLLTLSKSCGKNLQMIIGPEYTQAVLAEMVGTTRQRVNYFLGRFKELGAIVYHADDGIVVNETRLTELLDGKRAA